MKSMITYWKETDGKFLGYLNDYPDHWTQGDDLEDLKAHLRDLYHDFTTHDLPGIKKVEVPSQNVATPEDHRDEALAVGTPPHPSNHRTNYSSFC